MATVTMPSTTAWASVEPIHEHKAARFESPFTFSRQEFDWNVTRQQFVFTVPPQKEAGGLSWAEALRQLAIPGNTFVADVSDYVGTGTADKSSMTLELVRGSVSHRVGAGKIHYISFTAQKSL